MTIKQHGGVFGRNPSFNDVSVETLSIAGTALSSTAAELNILDGVTADAAELNYLDGASTSVVTASKAVLANASANIAFASGAGIDFSATGDGSGTSTSELFDDYEEGTWTPVLSDATSGGNTASFLSASGHYIKIGGIVHLFMEILNINNTGMTGTNGMNIQGLPYANASGITSSGTVVLDRVSISDFEYVVAQIVSNTDYIRLVGMISGAAESILLVNDFNNVSSDIQHLQISYRV